MADMPESSEELSVLKSTINKPIDKLETFPATKNVTNVKFFTDESLLLANFSVNFFRLFCV